MRNQKRPEKGLRLHSSAVVDDCKCSVSMTARCNVDHSAALLSRLRALVDSATCDVTFVLNPPDDTCARNANAAGGGSQFGDDPIRVVPGGPDPHGGDTSRKYSGKNGASHSVVSGWQQPNSERCDSSSRSGKMEIVDGDHASSTVAMCKPGRGQVAAAADSILPQGNMSISKGEERRREIKEEGGGGEGGERERDVAGDERRRNDDDAAATASTTTNPKAGPGRQFRCHRVLFAACSEYFRVLLYGRMSESQTRRVELMDVTPEGFEEIVNYVYTGRVLLTAGEALFRYSNRRAAEPRAVDVRSFALSFAVGIVLILIRYRGLWRVLLPGGCVRPPFTFQAMVDINSAPILVCRVGYDYVVVGKIIHQD